MIRVIVVDDEPLALRQMAAYAARVPEMELVGECSSAQSAMELLRANQVDAMFLDINMPEMSGIDLIRELDNPPLVVFTTAYPEHAVEGFRVNAVDYLLKPISFSLFEEACRKLEQRLGAEPRQDYIFVKSNYKVVRCRVSDIIYAQSMGEYLKIYLESEGRHAPVVTLLTMNGIMEKLPAAQFMRVHRSYIVNLSRVVSVSKNAISMDDSTQIPLSDNYRPEVKAWAAKALGLQI